MHAQDLQVGLEQVHAIYFNESAESRGVVAAVKDEDEAFWDIGEHQRKLGDYRETPSTRIRELVIEDDIYRKAQMLTLAVSTQLKPW
jgi:hypothetical protein